MIASSAFALAAAFPAPAPAGSHDYFVWLGVAGAILVFVALTTETIKRLPLSYAVVYLAVGILLGPAGLGLVAGNASPGLLLHLTELAVLVSLFSSGILAGRPLRWREWQTPARLLLVAMPLTILLLALFGWAALGMSVGAAVLLGAMLAPTDPVLASDVQVEGAHDPSELRFGLTGEAGLNDGLAFPFVTLGLALLADPGGFARWGARWALEDVLWAAPAGLAIGYGVAYVVGLAIVRVRRSTEINASLEAFGGLGLTVGTYAIADAVGAWGFLAAFAAGLAIGRVEREAALEARSPREREAPLGALHNFYLQLERLAEIAVMLALGAIIRWEGLIEHAWTGAAVAAALIFVIRPLAAAVAFLGSGLHRESRLLAGWFGIRGAGSLYYLAYAVSAGIDPAVAETLTWTMLFVVIASVVVHGTTATPLMNWYRRRAPLAQPAEGEVV